MQQVQEVGGDLPLVDAEPGRPGEGVAGVEEDDRRPSPFGGRLPGLAHQVRRPREATVAALRPPAQLLADARQRRRLLEARMHVVVVQN